MLALRTFFDAIRFLTFLIVEALLVLLPKGLDYTRLLLRLDDDVLGSCAA